VPKVSSFSVATPDVSTVSAAVKVPPMTNGLDASSTVRPSTEPTNAPVRPPPPMRDSWPMNFQ